MPKTTRDSLFADWRDLLKALQGNEERFAGAAPLRAALEKALVEAVAQRSLRDSLVASAQEATRRLNESVGEGREAAFRLRALVQGTLGHRAEELALYGIRPVRPRRFYRLRPITLANP